jgi:type III restriction enzyme
LSDVVIEQPIINSPFEEPARHYRFDEDGITNEIVKARRSSSYFMPIAAAKKRGKQLVLDSDWTGDRIEENENINRIRQQISNWRKGGYAGITPTTRRLLEHWNDTTRTNRLFFCQIEALETAIYITEVAHKYGDQWIENFLREQNESFNDSLPRMACKMATGSGKTVVMAMLIAWQTLNKGVTPQDTRFTDSFLIVSPGITIRDRLRVLLPNEADNYYRARDILPNDLLEKLNRARIVITNFHVFLLKQKQQITKAGRVALGIDETRSPFKEKPEEMARRVCKDLGSKNIIVLNDEAHHCYKRAPQPVEEKLSAEDKKEAEERNKEALVWISGLKAVDDRLGIKRVFDLSATPFFLNGSGWEVNKLFPWTVSDFSLVDAIESGIVKIPRVPVKDDRGDIEGVTYRELWPLIREALPKKNRKAEELGGKPELPVELEGAIQSLYSDYKKSYEQWLNDEDARQRGQTPPVFIVVCNNTSVSKLVYNYISGYDKDQKGQTVTVPGALEIFSNVQDNQWIHRPNTILVDSAQLESGEALTKEFKAIASREIEEFKFQYQQRYNKDADSISDEDILREVMNTVGKPGKLGEHVKCVVSVSMLTEGWDANTVTHILGVRAFGTQLLCEQVVGRGLRRMSYASETQSVVVDGEAIEFESFTPEYAEVYGVPFSFIPTTGTGKILPPRKTTRVKAVESRVRLEITFPRVVGYKVDLPKETLEARFDKDARMQLTTHEIPSFTQVEPIVGEGEVHTLDDLEKRRENEVAFLIAKLLLEKYFTDKDNDPEPYLFPAVLAITKRWLQEALFCKDNTFPQMLLLVAIAHDAADKIYNCIVRSQKGEQVIKPILRPYDVLGSTKYVDFDTTKPTYITHADKCHVSHVVADTGSWEQKLAETLEDMKDVVSYVKNQSLGFTVPYTMDGESKNYYPDFIAKIKVEGEDDPVNLIIEVTGQRKKDKAARVSAATSLWIPAVNNHGEFGRWAFVEVTDPWDCKELIRSAVAKDHFSDVGKMEEGETDD